MSVLQVIMLTKDATLILCVKSRTKIWPFGLAKCKQIEKSYYFLFNYVTFGYKQFAIICNFRDMASILLSTVYMLIHNQDCLIDYA